MTPIVMAVQEDLIPWCCRHRWTMRYISVVVTLEFVVEILHTAGVL